MLSNMRMLSFGAIIAMLSVGPCFAANAGMAIVDDRGVTVKAPVKPERIAAISYLAVDVALALGIKPVGSTYMVAGRHPDFLLGMTKDMKQLGQRAKANLELVSELKPDVIIAMRRYTVGNAAQLEKIAPFVAYNIEQMSESEKEVVELSKLFGKPERGLELNAEFKKHVAEFAAKTPKNIHPRYQIMWAGDVAFSFHTENTAASIVTALGGDNIAGPMTQSDRFGIDLSLESMLEKDPEVIFVYDSGPDRPHESNPIWQELSAVKNGRVHYVGDEWVESNGPIAREVVLREAAHYLYPDTFPPVNVRAEAAKLIPADLQR